MFFSTLHFIWILLIFHVLFYALPNRQSFEAKLEAKLQAKLEAKLQAKLQDNY